MQCFGQIITITKSTSSFLQAGCCPTNSIRALKEKSITFTDLLTPSSIVSFPTFSLTTEAPDYLRGRLLHLSSALFNALADDLRDPAVSITTFGRSMKTHLFSAYQHSLRIRGVSRNALYKYTILTYLPLAAQTLTTLSTLPSYSTKTHHEQLCCAEIPCKLNPITVTISIS